VSLPRRFTRSSPLGNSCVILTEFQEFNIEVLEPGFTTGFHQQHFTREFTYNAVLPGVLRRVFQKGIIHTVGLPRCLAPCGPMQNRRQALSICDFACDATMSLVFVISNSPRLTSMTPPSTTRIAIGRWMVGRWESGLEALWSETPAG